MKNSLLLSGFCLIFNLTACNQDSITTYRIPKEAPGQGLSMEIPTGAARALSWKLPKGWTEQSASGMRAGSFLAKGLQRQTVDISVIPLSGEAGGDLPNINRWRNQISLAPLSEEEIGQNSARIHPAGRPMLFVDFVSSTPLIDNHLKKRVMAAIYKQGETSWFFKMTGDDESVRAAKPSFIQFLESVKFRAHE